MPPEIRVVSIRARHSEEPPLGCARTPAPHIVSAADPKEHSQPHEEEAKNASSSNDRKDASQPVNSLP
eukprot:8102552-Prorocentrum_lima.AAC.1